MASIARPQDPRIVVRECTVAEPATLALHYDNYERYAPGDAYLADCNLTTRDGTGRPHGCAQDFKGRRGSLLVNFAGPEQARSRVS